MKYKYQGVFLPIMVISKVDEIEDTKVGHHDLEDFVKELRKIP